MLSWARTFIITLAVAISIIGSAFLYPTTSYAKSNNEVLWGCAAWEQTYYNDFGCPDSVDIVTSPWILSGYEPYHTTWLNYFNLPENQDKIPYIHTYTIAASAREEWGLQDCNVDPVVNLCWRGATYLKENEQNILNKYQTIASSIAINLPTDEVYIHLEPDYFQYTANTQESPLSDEDAWRIMNSITSIFRSTLPQAKLVMDISAWNYSLSHWCSGFENFDYGGLVGRWFDADIDPDGQPFSKLSQDCNGMELIVNTAHGVAGYFNGYNAGWETNNNNAHAVIQSPVEKARYQEFLDSLESLPAVDLPNSYEPQPVTTFEKPEQSLDQIQENNTNLSVPSTGDSVPKETVNIDGIEYYTSPELEKVLQELEPVEK